MTHDDLRELLQELTARDATEILIKVPSRPLLRIDGRLIPSQRPPVFPKDSHALANALLAMARLELALATVQHREFSFGVSGLGRFHVTLYRQRGSLAISITRILMDIPDLESLDVPSQAEASLRTPGLSLICGDRRRTQVMAALIQAYNRSLGGTIMVIEDPLTYLHRDGTAIVAQRGVGTDVASFAAGVTEARRLRTQLLAVGDVPDRQTAEAVLRAAEDHMVVLACVAAPDPSLAASWLLRHFESDRDSDVKQRVKRVLRGVVCITDQGPARVVARRSSVRVAS